LNGFDEFFGFDSSHFQNPSEDKLVRLASQSEFLVECLGKRKKLQDMRLSIGGGGVPSALEYARLLWQKHSKYGNVSDPMSPTPASMPAAAGASAPPMNHSYKAADISP
jgi:hypothetical protein